MCRDKIFHWGDDWKIHSGGQPYNGYLGGHGLLIIQSRVCHNCGLTQYKKTKISLGQK